MVLTTVAARVSILGGQAQRDLFRISSFPERERTGTKFHASTGLLSKHRFGKCTGTDFRRRGASSAGCWSTDGSHLPFRDALGNAPDAGHARGLGGISAPV